MKRKPNIGELMNHRPDILEWIQGDGDMEGLFDLPTSLSAERVALYKRLHQGVGHSPVRTLLLPNGGQLHLKMESANAMGGSHYSRYWLPYLFIAETLGAIEPGRSRLVEVTSGNSGLTLALAAKPLGYDVTLLAPRLLPERRVQPIRDAGAEVIVVEGYVKECVALMRRMLAGGQYFTPNHSEERTDLLVHAMRRISIEYLRDHAAPDTVFAALGNGCSTVGILQPFVDRHPGVARHVYWPAKSFDTPVVGLMIQEVDLRHIGMAQAMGTTHAIEGKLSEVKQVVRDQVDMSGFDPGWSTWLGMYLALRTLLSGTTGLLTCYDGGERY